MASLVLFDLDNTLVPRTEAFREWAARFLGVRGLATDGEVEWLEQADGDGFVPRLELFERVRARYGLAETTAALVDAYADSYPRCYPPVDGVTESALARLRGAGHRVGIVTNGPPSQGLKLELTGLGHLVDGVAISALVGWTKPDAKIFAAAAAACGCSLAGGWMVGDDPEADIGGAAACGLRTVWIRRGRTWTDTEFAPDHEADDVVAAVSHILGDAG